MIENMLRGTQLPAELVVRGTAIAAALFALSGCTQSGATAEVIEADPLAEALDDSEQALLGDSDLDEARALPNAKAALSNAAASDFDIPITAAAPRRATSQEGLTDIRIEDIREALEPKGRITYVQKFVFGSFQRYWLRLVTVRDFQFPARLIYRGRRVIESASVSEDGNLVTFSAENEGGDLDVFLLDLGGELGPEREVYLLGGGAGDQSDVSMSLDGAVHTWQGFDEVSATANHVVANLDRVTGSLLVTPFNITLGGMPIQQTEPAVNGSGNDVYFINDDEVSQMFFGAPIIVRFATDGSSGAIAFAGTPSQTTGFSAPSATFSGERLLFTETFDGVRSLVTVAPDLGEFSVIFEDTAISHPFITADGRSFTHAAGGRVFKSEINSDDPSATESVALPGILASLFPASSPTWSQALPPPPPPPPGTIIVDGTTIGGPTFDRPDEAGPGQLGDQVAYDAFAFTSLENGFYDIRSDQDYDGYLHLYEAPFDPAQPLVNLIAGNDDLETNRASGFGLLLDGSTDYVLVTSAFAAGDEGNFTNTIIPPQIPASGEAPTIEVLTESVRVAEPGQAIDYSFFVANTDATTCSVDYGDGTVDAVACDANAFSQASHSFASAGFFTVVVTATSAGGSATAKAFPTIAANDPNAFDIVVVFGNDQLSPAQREAFQTAADRWGQVIGGDLGSVSSGSTALPANYSCRGEPAFNGVVDDLVISAVGEPIDGPGAVLGSAGPCRIRDDGTNGVLAPLPVYGAMRFDVADLAGLEADGTLEAVILHEMGHVLGLGTLWNANSYLEGTVGQGADPDDPSYDPRYLGPVAIDQFNVLLAEAGQPPEATVPAANTGGAGTRESHWREATFVNELMTGFLGAAPNPISILTIGALDDLGYVVDFTEAEPYGLPSPFAVLFRGPARGHDITWTVDDVK